MYERVLSIQTLSQIRHQVSFVCQGNTTVMVKEAVFIRDAVRARGLTSIETH